MSDRNPFDDPVPRGVATRVVVQAMSEKRLPRVRLEDGTLGIAAEALNPFHIQTA